MGDLLAEAEELRKEALAGRRKVLCDEHSDTVASIVTLGSVLQSRAKKAAEDAVRIGTHYMMNREEFVAAGGSSADFDRYQVNGDGVLDKQQLEALVASKLAEAEPLYREALKWRCMKYGVQHSKTRMLAADLGRVLEGMGKLDELSSL